MIARTLNPFLAYSCDIIFPCNDMKQEVQVLLILIAVLVLAILVVWWLYQEEKKARSSAVAGHEIISRSLLRVGEKMFRMAVEIALENLTTKNKDRTLRRVESIRDFLRKNSLSIQGNIFGDIEKKYKQLLDEEEQEVEQARIREQMRDEAKAEWERNEETARLERENRELQKRIAQEQMKELTAKQAKIIEELQAKLLVNKGASERIKSMAQLTKVGKIYVISNVGSFGERVFKIGMTRRLFYEKRVDELGDASVPFPFDIHMIIETNDARALEKHLHAELHQYRLNLVNFRKEFFSVGLEEIERIVTKHQEVVSCEIIKHIPHAPAHQFRETLRLRGEGALPPVDESVHQTQHSDTILEELFYLYQGEQMTGPFPYSTVGEMLQEGKIDGQTMICRNGDSNWSTIEEFSQPPGHPA